MQFYKPRFLAFASVFFLVSQVVLGGPVKPPSSDTVLRTLRKGRPRILLTADRVAEIKKMAKHDELLKQSVAQVVELADEYLSKPLDLEIHHKFKTGIYKLGLAWQLTGDKKYAQRGRADLLRVAAMDEWTPDYFLGLVAYAQGSGIGYDWFYDALSEEDRQTVRAAIIRHALRHGVTAYQEKHWWTSWGFNWNQACNTGLIIASLAIADTEPSYAREIIPAAVGSLPNSLHSYGPDGAWAEGASYWAYATGETVVGIEALRTALGTDYGLAKIPGVIETGLFPIFISGPSGQYLHFADCAGDRRRESLPFSFWFARESGDDRLVAEQLKMIKRHGAKPMDVVFYPSRPSAGTSLNDLPLDKHFRGPMELAVFRSSWDDPKAMFLSVKGGWGGESHAHLDLGGFEFEALGVRWAGDLGIVNYDLPGQWGKVRFQHYRTGSLSHNVPLIDNTNQNYNTRARFARFQSASSADEASFAIVELTPSYRPKVARLHRGVKALPGRRQAIVQDEYMLEEPCEIAWGMTTSAKITIDGATATLRQDGETCQVTILEPSGASFSVDSAEQAPPQKPNKGFKRLMIRRNATWGLDRIAVLLAPEWEDEETSSVKVTPLAEW